MSTHKKLITGVPTITRERKIVILGDYYRDADPDVGYIGPPVEAVDTAVFEFTGRWRLVGDVDHPVMEVEVDVDWTETLRRLKWSWTGWEWDLPFMVVEVSEPIVMGTTVWMRESSIHWLMPDIINHSHSGGRIK